MKKIIARTGVDFEIRLPHKSFARKVGVFAKAHVSPEGEVMTEQEWAKRKSAWLTSSEDAELIHSLMQPSLETGAYASWVAPPRVGIDGKPGAYEYMRFT